MLKNCTYRTKDYILKSKQKQRRYGSKKRGCPFKLYAICESAKQWMLNVKNGIQNHMLSNSLTKHLSVVRIKD